MRIFNRFRKKLAELKSKRGKNGKIKTTAKEVKKMPGVFIPSDKAIKKAAAASGLEWKNGKLRAKYGEEIKDWEYEKFKRFLRKWSALEGMNEKEFEEIYNRENNMRYKKPMKMLDKIASDEPYSAFLLPFSDLSPVDKGAFRRRFSIENFKGEEDKIIQRLVEEEGLTKKQALQLIKEFEKTQARKKKKGE